MIDLTQGPSTDPTNIYRHRDALYASDMLVAALKGFDFFTWMSESGGGQSVDSICRHFGFDPRPVDVMTTLFAASGWLERKGGQLALTGTAREHLVKHSPWFIGPYFPPVNDRPVARELLQCLKSGKPVSFGGRKDHKDWHKAMEQEAFAREFTAMMDCRGVVLAQALARNLKLEHRRSLLDIAGGSGIYACSLAARFPKLTATVFEKEPVDRVCRAAVQERGLSDRVNVVAGDMLAGGLPGGHDVHLCSNVLHDWDVGVVQELLRKSCEALPAGGLSIVHDAFLNEDKTGPLHVAEYSVLLMHVTQGRCYSKREIREWGEDAGLAFLEEVPSAAVRSALVFQKS